MKKPKEFKPTLEDFLYAFGTAAALTTSGVEETGRYGKASKAFAMHVNSNVHPSGRYNVSAWKDKLNGTILQSFLQLLELMAKSRKVEYSLVFCGGEFLFSNGKISRLVAQNTKTRNHAGAKIRASKRPRKKPLKGRSAL